MKSSRNRNSIPLIVAPARKPFEIGSKVLLPNGKDQAEVLSSSPYYTKVAIQMKTKIKEALYTTFKLKSLE